MRQDGIAPGRFRWRLTVAFIAVAATSAGVLAGGSYILVRNHREASFEERSIRDASLSSTIVETMVRDGTVEQHEVPELLRTLRRREAFESVIILPDGTARSTGRVEAADVPTEMRAGRTPIPLELERRGIRYLIIPGEAELAGTRLFYFFPKTELLESLQQLGAILWRLWLVVVVGSALVGSLVAKRALRPVARASRAAHALAEGLLDTRLPVDSEDEFGAWAVSFNQMAEALQEKIDALVEAGERERRFTSDVSHELRTPLSALVTSASMLEAELARIPEDLQWQMNQQITQIKRVRRLLEELMEISRLDAGKHELQLEDTHIGSVVESIVRHRGWSDVVRFHSNGVRLKTDRRRLERVLSNLIENGLEHGAPPIDVVARPNSEFVEIVVTDHGKGVPPEERSRIFDRFYKGDPSRAGGSGLGLSIVKENIRILGGETALDSAEGNGSAFRIRLPM